MRPPVELLAAGGRLGSDFNFGAAGVGYGYGSPASAGAAMAGGAPGGMLAAAGLDALEGLSSPNGRARWNTTLGYEQLLSIQQHQHTLAMQHKEAEVAHIKACMDLLESERPHEDKDKLTEALRSKDEEAALMMAAKHKELELMASLLQLREQQIEDLRQLCETQQAEITQLKRRHAGAQRQHPHGSSVGGASIESVAAPGRGGGTGAAVGRRDDAPSGSPGTGSLARRSPGSADDHATQMEREVRRLRLKMEEMESAILEQNQRSAGLAEALEQKSERVKALEQQVRSLQQSPSGTWPDSGDSVVEAPALEQQRGRPPRLQHAPGYAGDLSDTVAAGGGGAYRAAATGDQERTRTREYAPPSRADLGRGDFAPPHGGLRRTSVAQSLPRLPLPPQQAPQGRWDGGGSSAEAPASYPQYSGVVEQRPGGLGGVPTLPPQLRPPGSRHHEDWAAPRRRDGAAPPHEPVALDVSQPSISQLPSYRSAVRVDTGGHDGRGASSLSPGRCGGSGAYPGTACSSGLYPGTCGSGSYPGGGGFDACGGVAGGCGIDGSADTWRHSAPEAAETGRQSEELLREMRRLRLQMSELERVAGARCGSGRREQGAPNRLDALGTMSSGNLRVGSLGLGGAAAGPAHAAAEAPPPREPISAAAGAAARGSPWQWPRPCASQPALALLACGSGACGSSPAPAAADLGQWEYRPPPSGGPPPQFPLACGSGACGSSPAPAAGDFGGWEYRPHASGDTVDAAVAALVNQPNGRYRSWRALLCRLEHGVYLCGTRRVHLRADAAAGVIEASADGGATWSDLADLMRGSEASQHALLERARGGIAGGGTLARASAWGGGLGA